MIDWARLVGFDWDAGNERKSADKHRVTQAEAEQAFFNQPLLVLADERHGVAESRFHALGRTEAGRRLHVMFTIRQEGSLIRAISARDVSARERAIYEETS